MRIVRRITPDMLELLTPISDASLAGEEVLLRIGRSGLTLGYVPLAKAEWRVFPAPDQDTLGRLAASRSAAVFAAFDADHCIGICAVAEQRYGWAELLDIRVDAAKRRSGAASMLLDSCVAFAERRGLRGMTATASDANPAVCQFLEHKGFTLQGFDRLALAYAPEEADKPLARRACALFFYQLFKKG